MSNDVKLDIEIRYAMAFLGFALHISPFVHNEGMELFGALHNITSPIVIVLETGVVPLAVLDRTCLSQLVIPIASDTERTENVKVRL